MVLNSGRYQQNDFRLNLDHRPSDKLSFGVSVYHSQSERQNLYGDAFFDLINQAPDVDLRTPDPGRHAVRVPARPRRPRGEPAVRALHRDQPAQARAHAGQPAGAATCRSSWLTFDGNLSYDRSDRRNNFFLDAGVKTEGFGEGGPGEISQFTGTTNAVNAWGSANVLKQLGDFTLRGTGARAAGARDERAHHRARATILLHARRAEPRQRAEPLRRRPAVQSIRTNSYIGSARRRLHRQVHRGRRCCGRTAARCSAPTSRRTSTTA